MGFGCPRALPGTRHAHEFEPFAADMAGETRTVAVIFCRRCGVVRAVEVTPEMVVPEAERDVVRREA
jgi:hypothetical protein